MRIKVARCSLPSHVYDTVMARPVAILLRPGNTRSGSELRGHLRRLVHRIRKHWPQTHIIITAITVTRRSCVVREKGHRFHNHRGLIIDAEAAQHT
jgi:hypothetical protein